MGRGSSNPQDARSCLTEDDSGNFPKLAPDLVDQCCARGMVRFAGFLPLVEKRFNSRDGSSDEPSRAAVKPALLGFASLRPCRSDVIVEVRLGAVSQTTVDESQSMANAREARNRFGIGDRHLRFGLCDQVKHLSGLRGRA